MAKSKLLNDELKSLSSGTTNVHGKKIKTDVKMRFHTGIASVALFNTIFTLIKPYIPHITF